MDLLAHRKNLIKINHHSKQIYRLIWIILIATGLLILGHITARLVNAGQEDNNSMILEPLPDRLRSTSLDIARCYSLTKSQAILLLAIHDHENGEEAGKEFGIEHQKEKICDPIERYCRYACKSALAIKRYCPETDYESIHRFGRGYGHGKNRYPGYAEDPLWPKKVFKMMKKYSDILY